MWSGDPPGGSDVVRRRSWRSESGQETLLEIQKWSDTLPEVWNWSETIPEVWNWSGYTP